MPSSLFLEWLCQDVYVIETSITEQAMMKPMAVGRKMTQCVKCLLSKHEHRSLDPQHLQKARCSFMSITPSVRGKDRSIRRGLLASKSS